MKTSRTPRHVRGFSLIEVVIVIAVIGVLVAVAYPSVRDSVHRSKINDVVRGVQEDISRARAIATSNASTNTDPNVRVRSAIVRFQSAASYQILQTDAPSGRDPTIVETVKVVVIPSSLELTITEPAAFPADMVFRSNGALVGDGVDRIKLHDQSVPRDITLNVSMMGSVEVE